MGFSSVAGYIILFMVIVGMVFVLVTSQTLIVKERSGAIEAKSEITSQKETTMINLTDGIFTTSNLTLIFVNNGIEKLHLDRIDVFINTTLLSDSEYNLEMVESTNIINSQLWDPGESINLTILKGLSQGNAHIIVLTLEYGVKKSIGFSVGGDTAILTSASSTKTPGEDVFSFIQFSDAQLATNDAKKNKDNYMYANFSLSSPSLSGYNLIIDHYWDSAADLNIQDVEIWNGTAWEIIGSLSPYTSEGRDTFPLADLYDYTNTGTRLHFNPTSNRVNYVNYMTISANVTQFYEIN